MFYVVYNNQTGNLVDVTDSIPSLQESSYSIKAFDTAYPDLYYYKWDNTLLSFVPKSNIDRQITVHEFLSRFTAIERITIKEAAKTNPALADYMEMLYQASFVDPDSPELYGGLYYLTILGLITQDRIPALVA